MIGAQAADAGGPGQPTALSMLATLDDWAGQGWLRHLDVALARFVAQHSPAHPPCLPLAAALVSQLEGQGHVCLPLDALARDPAGLLGWGPEAAEALAAVLACLPSPVDWPAHLIDCAAVATPEAAVAASKAAAAVPEGAMAAPDAAQGQPLVLHAQRLYLRRYWACEQRLAAQVLARGRVTEAGETVDIARARSWLARLFPAAEPAAGSATATATATATAGGPPAAAPADTAFDWQQAACAVALRGRLAVITGGPGTGKTYTAARLLALLLALSDQPASLRIALAAPTGKAAARLRQAIDAALASLQQRLGDVLPWHLLADQVGAARTLHGLLGARPDTRHLRHGPARPLEVDVLIVDEASMVHLQMMAALMDALPPQARLVLLGDKDQLASVEAGAVLGDLCQGAQKGRYLPATLAYLAAATGQAVPPGFADADGPPLAQQTVMLRRSQRFGGAIASLAAAVNDGDAAAAQAVLRAEPAGAVAWLATATPAAVAALALAGRDGAAGGYQRCVALLAQRPPRRADSASSADQQAWVAPLLRAFEQFRVLCALREGDWGVAGLNRAIEARLAQAGLLQPRSEWYEGRPVIVTRNDADLGVFNGDIGLALRTGGGWGGVSAEQPGGLRVWFADGAALRSVSVSRLPAVETAFAMTVHKAQGSEFDHTVLVLPPEGARPASRELIYTGITRARSALTLVTAQPALLALGLARRTRRSSGLADLLAG